jgi:hypothetical protein
LFAARPLPTRLLAFDRLLLLSESAASIRRRDLMRRAAKQRKFKTIEEFRPLERVRSDQPRGLDALPPALDRLFIATP